jgi:hypothetical protein
MFAVTLAIGLGRLDYSAMTFCLGQQVDGTRIGAIVIDDQHWKIRCTAFEAGKAIRQKIAPIKRENYKMQHRISHCADERRLDRNNNSAGHR